METFELQAPNTKKPSSAIHSDRVATISADSLDSTQRPFIQATEGSTSFSSVRQHRGGLPRRLLTSPDGQPPLAPGSYVCSSLGLTAGAIPSEAQRPSLDHRSPPRPVLLRLFSFWVILSAINHRKDPYPVLPVSWMGLCYRFGALLASIKETF